MTLTAPRARRRAGPAVAVGLLGAGALFAVVAVVGGLMGLGWLGQEEVVDRGTVIGVLREESSLSAGSRDYRVRVEFAENELGDWAPSWLFGRRLIVDVDGTVAATVDLADVTEDAVTVDGQNVTVRLPSPTTATPTINDITVVTDDRGFINRMNDFMSSDPEKPDQIVSRAQEQLSAAANSDYELNRLARERTTEIISGLLEPTVEGTVSVEFDDPPTTRN